MAPASSPSGSSVPLLGLENINGKPQGTSCLPTFVISCWPVSQGLRPSLVMGYLKSIHCSRELPKERSWGQWKHLSLWQWQESTSSVARSSASSDLTSCHSALLTPSWHSFSCPHTTCSSLPQVWAHAVFSWLKHFSPDQLHSFKVHCKIKKQVFLFKTH